MDRQKEVVIVTGSSGLIGKAVVQHLAQRFQVVGFDRDGNPHPPIEAECVCVDVTSERSIHSGLQRVCYAHGDRIASVIHLAAYYDFSGDPSPLYEEVTVRGTQRLLRALQAFTVEQFIFSSTMLVHAPCQPGQAIDEQWPLEPKWDYPQSKVQTEQLIHAERGDIPVVQFRIAGVYDDHGHSIPLAHQVQRIYERQLTSHLFSGDITHGQAFVHLDDVVEACALLVEHRHELPAELPLLLGETDTLSYAELQQQFGHLIHNEEWKTYSIPKPLAKIGAWLQDITPLMEEPFIKPWMIDIADDHYALDITRVRTLLGWEPQRTLRATLPKIVAALQADPLGWYQENKLNPPSSLRRAPAQPSVEEAENDDHEQPGDMTQSNQDETEPHQPMAMGERGSARPQMDMSHGHGEMTPTDRRHMLQQHHAQTLWVPLLVLLLGVWLITTPFTLGYSNPDLAGSEVARITAERGLLDMADRGLAMTWSDILSGVLLVVLSLLWLNPRRLWAPWAACFVGIWLLFAPLLFWAPTAAAYANGTLIGTLVIALTVLIPGMPGMISIMKMGPEIPPGWSYNPSSWLQRAPVIALGWVGFFAARYLTAYQLGYIDSAWDPFFGSGTMRILDSEVSRAWPISDAGLGSMTYVLEALMGYMGGTQRWRTMPWMVLLFGVLVVPLGIVSITLVILQPVAVGTWCTLCLLTALAMLIMIPLTLDEVVAMLQFMAQSRRAGKPLWSTFWKGGTVAGGGADSRTPPFTAPLVQTGPAMVWGVTVPWTLLLSTMLGIWLMAAPAIFQTEGAAADSNHLVGALVVTLAVIAMAEVTRAARWLNVLAGVWIVVMPWLLSGASPAATWNNVIVGVLLIALSLPRGSVRERYGNWDRFLV